ncbi:unnamed protein product [Phyllotreta striolata]|uniref:COX assembly mitochondrial protein n=1 Tax=Phyllotreta striolata TaxID=444603 RepID=A0A9N9XMV4_PHYSR|nr:unnamed protein product [Phyllotreta striolata]
MHTDLSAHLHNKTCNELIQLLSQCHSENPFLKFFGVCNPEDDKVVKCLKEERLERRRINYEKSLEMKARLKKKFEEQRENKL